MSQLKNQEGNQSFVDTQSPKKRVMSKTYFIAKEQRLKQQEELKQLFKTESENGIRQGVSLKEANELFSMIKNAEGNKSIERSYHSMYNRIEIINLYRKNGKWLRTISSVSTDSNSGGYLEAENEEISEQRMIEEYFTSLPYDVKIFIKEWPNGKIEWKPGTHKE